MKITNTQNYTLISSDHKSSFLDTVSTFKKEYPKLKEKHLFIQLSNNFNIVEKDILVFLRYAMQHQKNGMTFVVIATNFNIDSFPEEFNIVPTLQEAIDVLEFENVQRELGF